jgi:hypothetical protein
MNRRWLMYSNRLDWEKSQRIDGDVVEEVHQRKGSDGPTLQIWGSSKLLQTLIAADLVDEYRMRVFPVVLGEGKRLFENGVPPRGLTLVETRSTPRGVLVNTYHPAGPLPRRVSLARSGKEPSEEELARRQQRASTAWSRRRGLTPSGKILCSHIYVLLHASSDRFGTGSSGWVNRSKFS